VVNTLEGNVDDREAAVEEYMGLERIIADELGVTAVEVGVPLAVEEV
jgi:hypothetical protein